MLNQQQQNQMMHQLPIEQRYAAKCHHVVNTVVPENPNYKDQVGNCIYEFVTHIIGTTKAPKVTGMIIELPIDDIKLIMQSWSLLNTRIQQASDLLDQNPGQW